MTANRFPRLGFGLAAALLPVCLLAAGVSLAAGDNLRKLGEQYLTGDGVPADPAKALDYLERAAAAGDMTAQRKLAVALIRGEGLTKDAAKGLPLLEGAAAKDAWAKVALAKLLLAGTDLPKDAARGLALLEEAAATGNAGALSTLGQAYLSGDGVAADPAKARDYLERAAAAGDVAAQRKLAMALIRGEGLTTDAAKGLPLLEAAAAKDVWAKVALAKLLLAGTDLPRDTARGVNLLEEAAASGNADALATLGQAYLSGTGIAADPAKARDYLERAVTAGDRAAQRKLALALIKGEGLPKDTAKGLQLLRAAADDPQALTNLGRLYLEGVEVERDIPKAAGYFEAAAKRGEYGGLETLGSSYLSGEHTQKNTALGRKFLTRAAEGGRGQAWVKLARAAASDQLGPDSAALYLKFADSARATKAPGIDIVDAERYFWGRGVPKDPARGIDKLVLAAKAGNTDAMTYLISLYRDGRKNVAPKNTAKAAKYFAAYELKLPATVRVRQQLLLKLAGAAGPEDYRALLGDSSAAPALANPEIQAQVWKANPNFAVYRLQVKLQSLGIYKGPLNGLATAATLKSMQAACGTRKDGFICGGAPLTPRVVYRLTFQPR